MKTFLGFTTGLLTGFIGGAFSMALLSLVSDSVKEAIMKESEKLDIHW